MRPESRADYPAWSRDRTCRPIGTDPLTFTVITTDPNEVIEPMHDSMPVVIPERDYDHWLKLGDPDRAPIDLLRPFDASKMTAWKVDKAVSNVKNDTPELINPATHSIDGESPRLF